MSERGEFEPNNNPTNPSEKESKGKKMTRRAFLVGAAAVAGGVIVERTGVIKKAGEWYEKRENDKLDENVGREKGEVKKDIDQGLQDEGKFKDLLTRHNNLVETSRRFDRQSDQYRNMDLEAKNLSREIKKFYTRRGSHSLGLVSEANPYAEKLKENDPAIVALATARVLYREGVDDDYFGNKEFPYWHNFALAYLELGSKSREQIKTKFKALFEYAKANDIKVSRIPFEQILYCLIDDNFDFSLKPSALESILRERFPTWEQYPPTHADKNSYEGYNDLSGLDIFELNRLRATISQLQNRNFVSNIFHYRDEDLKDASTELGGVIPLPNKENILRVLPAKQTGDNDAYVVPDEQAVELFAGIAGFHFHATKKEEPPKRQGPSGGDHALFAPGVVFSSVNDSTILVHFYTSRARIWLGVKNEVVCLGEIKKNQ